MVAFKSLDEIVLSMLDFARLVQPDLDTKPGSVARDIFIDLPASELSKIYGQLRNISNLQSLAAAVGTDLDKQTRNFGIFRNTGTAATGPIVLTINSLTSNVFIPSGTQIGSRSKIRFRTLADASFDVAKANIYRSNALRIRSELDLAGITDQYALEVRAECTQVGSVGNAGKFSIISQSIPGISNVTNIQSFTGGAGAEDDAAFRARALGIFAGSNVGTTLGYINKIKEDPRVLDVLAVEPGDPLMTRDGSQAGTDSNGNRIIISIGTGGKVDLYIQGTAVESFSESFIFRDFSGKNDPTDPKNDFILGQRSVNPALVFQQKRKILTDAGTLPFQPVDSVVSVTGSLSGPNFVEKFLDENGNTKGTYELIKDDNAYGGSVFGFDRIHFISNQIELIGEVSTKGAVNSQDPLDFSDVNLIVAANQDIIVSNENSTVNNSDRSILTLAHTPISTVTRVQNLTTGERYKIVTQNLDNTTNGNETGRIQISGATLPTSTDILQTNYIWQQGFDEFVDFDNLASSVFTRTVQDSIDWGFANRVNSEEQSVLYDVDDGYHIITDLPISRVVNVNVKTIEAQVNVGGKLTMADTIVSIESIKDSQQRELYNTKANNGSFSGFEITLPTDTLLQNGETATVYYNVQDLYSPSGTDTGSFGGNLIFINSTGVFPGATVYVDYVADVSVLLPTTALLDLPVFGENNQFVVSDDLIGNQPIQNRYSGDSIARNLKYAPTYLRMTMQGITQTGRLTIKGDSFTKIDEVITIRKESTTVDLSEAIKSHFGITSIPSTMYVAAVQSIERVALSGGQISSTEFSFDVINYEIKKTSYSNGAATPNTALTAYEVKLSGTEDNLNDIPSTGQSFRVVFYVIIEGDLENITISASGTTYSKNKYSFVEKVSVTSGFVGLSGSTDGTILIESATQPIAGTSYTTDYNYRAPKEGERIVVNYNYNRLIADSTLNLEDVRPVTADVLVKAATAIIVNVSVKVFTVPGFSQNQQTFIQNIQQAITTFLTQGGLNRIVDSSDIIDAIYSVDGTDRVDILFFNVDGQDGVVRSIVANRNEYFTAGVIDVTIGER